MSPVLLGYRHHESQLSMPKIGSRHQESTRSCLYIQEKERLGQYGLSQWDRYRRYMIARLFRAISIGALHRGEWGDAFLLYFKSFFWNVLAMRWQYVLGFWFVFLQSGILRHGLRYTGIRK